jgi:DNA repair exonuclease SbcCD ATPase subunit
MKIVALTAENIKKLRAVEIKPNGEIVTIAGKNGAGKSSVLDSIWWALAGTSHIQAQPIRKGENKARIRLDLGELIVERRFTESGSTLFVENAEGARFPSPQKMLDALLGELSFDPLAFARMEPRKQFDELRRVSKLEVDIDQLDALNRGDYAKRTDVNRDAKAKRAQAQAIAVATDLPDAPLDESALLDEIQKAGEHNAQLEQRKARREQAQRDANDKKAEGIRLRSRAAELRAEADRLDKQASDVMAEAAAIEKKIDEAEALPAPIDVAAIRVKLEHAKQVNAKIVARDRRQQIEKEAAVLEEQSRQLTLQMSAREEEKQRAIAAAQMPVDGLGFGDGVVTYNGVPLEQASSAEQLKVSLGIAMAANPKLRVIRIQDGSLLDDDSLAQIAAMAKDGGYQVWVEKVDTTGKIGVVIDDGMVVAVDGQKVKQAEEVAA